MAIHIRQVDTRAADSFNPRIGRRRLRMAAPARAIPRLLRAGRGIEEDDAVDVRTTAGTRRPAVDARRCDGVDERRPPRDRET
jgi:hypothetical protein